MRRPSTQLGSICCQISDWTKDTDLHQANRANVHVTFLECSRRPKLPTLGSFVGISFASQACCHRGRREDCSPAAVSTMR